MGPEETTHLLMLGCLSRADELGMTIDSTNQREEVAKFLLALGWTYDLSQLEEKK